MSYTSQTKGDRNKAKFQASNINNVFKGKSTETQQKPTHRQYGMQVLGRVSHVRRMPRPSVLPSLKAETGGNDPRVNLVPPGGQGWGGSTETGSVMRNSRAEALLDSPPHQQTASTAGGSSVQGGRTVGAQPTAVSSGAENRSWSRVTVGSAGGAGGSAVGGGGGSGGGNAVSSSSGGGHNGWAPASGGGQGLSTASQRDFPKLGSSSAVQNATSGDTSLRPQGSLSGNWRDRGRTGAPAASGSSQPPAPLSPTNASESVDVSGGGVGIASQSGLASGGNRTSVQALVSSNTRTASHHPPFSSSVGGSTRTFADTGNTTRFDGSSTGVTGGTGNRTGAKVLQQSRTSVPLRTTLDDKAASTAPTGWAADQGELDFSERIVFSDEEEESPVPSKPKQMVSDEKVIGTSTNGDLSGHNRQHIPMSQAPPDFSGSKEAVVSQLAHPMSGSEMKNTSQRVTGQAVGHGSIVNRKPDDADSMMGMNTRPVVGLMQITPGSTAHPISLSHPHPTQQQHNFPPMSGVREAWASGPTANPGVPHQHQPGQFSMVFTQARMAQGPGFAGQPPAASLHPSAHHFSSNPSHILPPPVSAGGPIFAPSQEDKHLSDQRSLHQKEYKMCIERARMKKRTEEVEARGSGSCPVEEDRDAQRSRPRQRFDAPSGSSKGSVSDVTGLNDECEPSRPLPTAPREEGPPGGPPMPPVPIVAQAPPQPPAAAGHSSYPVPHGLPPPGPFNAIPAAAYGPRAPWPGPHPPGATAATYPHPPQPHPSFQHHQYAPPQAQIPTHLLDPNIRPKTTQEYTVLIEKFHEFLLQESKKDKNGKPEADQRNAYPMSRPLNDPNSKSVVEQKDPFAEEEPHDNRESSTKAPTTDASMVSALSQQSKHVKRESHQESNLVSGPSPGMKRPIAQTQMSRDENSQEPSQGARREFRPNSSERETQSSRGGAPRSDVWDDRSNWHRRKSEENEEAGVYGEEDTPENDDDKKRLGSRDIRVHGGSQKRNRNMGDQYYTDYQGRKQKTTAYRTSQRGGVTKPSKNRGGSVTGGSFPACPNFGSEEELQRPPRGGSAGQLSRSSSSLAERNEWHSDDLSAPDHRQSHQLSQQSQQHKRGGGAPRRGTARGSNANASSNRSRDYGPQTYATWAGSSSGMRSYSNYHRNNASGYGPSPMRGGRHRYAVDPYGQQPYYDDYSYDYNYSMDDFGGQWHPSQIPDRSKQVQQSRREGKKGGMRDRTTQNRSSAPPAGSNEKSEASQSSHQGSQQAADSVQTKGRREQHSRSREVGSSGRSTTSSGKPKPVSKKQGSTESTTSSNTESSSANKVSADQPKADEEKTKETEDKPVVQLQPAPAPAVNVWNTKHPLIANAPVSSGPSTPASDGMVVTDLMTGTVTMSNESRPQASQSSDKPAPKPLMPPPEASQSGSEEKDLNSESAGASGSAESRRGRESSKSRRERPSGRQGRGDKRGGSGRRGGGGTGGSGSGGAGGGASNVSSSHQHRETNDTKNQADVHSQSNSQDDAYQRNRRRNRQNKDNAIENMDSHMGYVEEEYADYEYEMQQHNYLSGRHLIRHGGRARAYRGYHYRAFSGGSRSYFQNYYGSGGGRSYYAASSRYYGTPSRYRSGGARSGSSAGTTDADGHGTASISGTGKRQGSVSKETVTSDGNEQEDWETASESSDVANRDSRRRPPSGGSGGGAAGGGSGGASSTPGASGSSSFGGSVSHQQQQQQSQQRQRGRQQKSCAMTPVSQTSEDRGYDDGSGSSTPQQSQQRKRNRMEGIDLNNFASVVAVDNLPEVTVDEEFLYDNAAEFVEVLSKSARKTKKREELKQKQEQEQLVQPRSRQIGGRRGTNVSDGSKRRTVGGAGSVGTSGSGVSPPKRLQSSKMTADERRRQKKAATAIVKPGSVVTPLLSTIPVPDRAASTTSTIASTTTVTAFPVSSATNSGTGRPNKTKLPPRLAKQQQQHQQQQQQQHVGNTTAPPLMSLDSVELEQSVMAADLSASRKGHSVSSASVTDFKIESWDNRLAEDIPKMRRNAEQILLKVKGQSVNTDSQKSTVLAPIAPPGNPNSVASAKTDSGVDTGGDVSDRSSHSSGGAATNEKRSQTPSQSTPAETSVSGQAINSALLEASVVVNSSLQTGDVAVDSSNEEYKLPDGFVLSCHRVTGDYDEMKPTTNSGTDTSASSNTARTPSAKVSEMSVPVRERPDTTKAADTRTLNDTVVSSATAVNSGPSNDQLSLPSSSVSLPSNSVQSAVEEGTSSLNKKIALVKSCWAEAKLPLSSTESETLLTTATVSSSPSVGDTETSVSSAVVISNVCKVKPQQKLSAPVATTPSVVSDEPGSVASAASNVADVPDSHSVFPGTSHLSTLVSSAPSFIPKAALIHPTNPQDSILSASGAAGVMFPQAGGFQHLGSATPRSPYGPPVAGTGFNAPSQPTPIGRSNNLYPNSATAKCPPVSLSIPMPQPNVTAKALSMGLGFGINGNGGNDSALLGHGAGGSNNAAMAALIQRQNSNSVGVIAPPTGPSPPQCSGYQSFALPNNMSSAAAGVPTPPTPTGGSWSNQYGPHLNFTPGLPNTAAAAAAAGAQQAWTFLKNQTPSAGAVQPGPGLASPNTPSPGPRQPFIFNLWSLGPSAQAQQSASGGQQTGLGAAANPGNHMFGAAPGPPNKFPVTSNASQIGTMPPGPPNLHNLVGLQQFRSGILDNNTNCSVQSSTMFDTSVFPQPPQQQQQPSFPTFPDFTSFSQPTQLPLKPQVAHSNAPGGVQGVPSQPHQHQPVDNIFALFANDFGSNRGNECKTPNLNPLCVAPYSQPAPQPQATSARYGISGLSSNITVPPAGMLNKHNALDMSTSAGMNPKPQSGWGTSGMIPVSSSSLGTNHTSHNPHFQRSSVGPIAPARSSPTVMGITSNSGPINAQTMNSNRRMVSGSPSLPQGQVTSQQSGYATQQYSGGPCYRSYGGNNSGNSRGSVGFGGPRAPSRGGVRGGGHATRGGVYGGAYRNNYRSSGGGGNSRLSQSRNNNYVSRNTTSGSTSSESMVRRLPSENVQNDEDGENRTVNQSLITSLSSASYTISTSTTVTASTPASTLSSCTTSTNSSMTATSTTTSSCTTVASTTSSANTETKEESSSEFDGNLPVTTSSDTSIEPTNANTVDGSRDIELDGPANAPVSTSPSPSDISKSGQNENSSVLLVDGAPDKLESVSLTTVMQNTDSSSQVSLPVATVKY